MSLVKDDVVIASALLLISFYWRWEGGRIVEICLGVCLSQHQYAVLFRHRLNGLEMEKVDRVNTLVSNDYHLSIDPYCQN